MVPNPAKEEEVAIPESFSPPQPALILLYSKTLQAVPSLG
jgi:hypothetical protein